MLELYGLKITATPSVYEPAEETFLLISALEIMNLKNKTILEIGTGSGIIALFAARFAKSVIAVDINPKAVECAKKNAELNKIKNAEFKQSDLFENVKGRFDIIVFNPPYLPKKCVCDNNSQSDYNISQTSDDNEPLTKDIALDGGSDGRKVIERFLKGAPKFLNPHGKILLLESSLSHYEKTISKLKKISFSAEIAARRKFDWEELVVIKATHIFNCA